MSSTLKFSDETLELVRKIIKKYPEGRQKSALLPILHIAQAEFGGWLSTDTMDYVSTILNIQPIEVYEVATFYTMFNLDPVGNCVIEVCRTGPCWLNGAEDIIGHLENKLNIKAGETSADGKFTLKLVECLAACGNAPVIQIGMKYHENVTTQRIDAIMEEYSCSDKVSWENPYKI